MADQQAQAEAGFDELIGKTGHFEHRTRSARLPELAAEEPGQVARHG